MTPERLAEIENIFKRYHQKQYRGESALLAIDLVEATPKLTGEIRRLNNENKIYHTALKKIVAAAEFYSSLDLAIIATNALSLPAMREALGIKEQP